MRIERTIHNEMSAAEVYAMTTSRSYQERKCRDAGATAFGVTVTDGPLGRVVRTRRKLPTDTLPSMLRKVVPNGMSSIETVTWGDWAADGTRTGQLTVDFHGSPASMTGTITIVPDTGHACDVVVSADFRAKIPLIGPRLEALAAPIIMQVIDAEQTTGDAWAAERP